jgi:GDP-L-fucose synthase
MTIVVAGSTGLAGSAILRAFSESNEEVIGLNRSTVDLRDRLSTFEFFRETRPRLVVDAAARVGGILANDTFPVDFLLDNIAIQNNLLSASNEFNVEKFVFLGSSCIYPRNAEQPIKEEYLMTGPLEKSNSAYSVAKISGIELVNSYRKQYGRKWITIMPTNLYGPGDNFDLLDSHVLPALIRKFVEAEENNLGKVTLWGTGEPLREFLHVDDLADAVVMLAEKYSEKLHINVGTGQDISISDLAKMISRIAGFRGDILWDSSKPNGTPRKVLDVTRLKSLGWQPRVELELGIKKTIAWYREARALNGVRI